MNEDKIQWKAFEYNHREKSSDWFWAVGIIAFSAAAAAIIFHNTIFAIFIVLSAFTLSMYAARKPSLINIELNNQGVIVDKYLFPYKNIEKFWVSERQSGNVLIIKSLKKALPFTTISTEQVDPEEIREYLSRHAKEEEMAEPFVQTMMEYLGF